MQITSVLSSSEAVKSVHTGDDMFGSLLCPSAGDGLLANHRPPTVLKCVDAVLVKSMKTIWFHFTVISLTNRLLADDIIFPIIGPITYRSNKYRASLTCAPVMLSVILYHVRDLNEHSKLLSLAHLGRSLLHTYKLPT